MIFWGALTLTTLSRLPHCCHTVRCWNFVISLCGENLRKILSPVKSFVHKCTCYLNGRGTSSDITTVLRGVNVANNSWISKTVFELRKFFYRFHITAASPTWTLIARPLTSNCPSTPFTTEFGVQIFFGLGIDPQWCHWGFFPWLTTEPCALGSTQPLNMRSRKIPGSKADRCVRLTTYHLLVPNVKKIRGLNLPDLPWDCSGL
jgi:hypothetical protein